MKKTTFRRLLIAGLICSLICALFGLVAVSAGKGSFIIAVICGVAAALPLCSELNKIDKQD